MPHVVQLDGAVQCQVNTRRHERSPTAMALALLAHHGAPPTMAMMDALPDGSAIVAPFRGDEHEGHRTVYVRACAVDRTQIYFVCPFCWTRVKKNGEPYAQAHRVEHHHGSSGDRSVRFDGHRAKHCTDTWPNRTPCRFPGGINDFYLVVTPSTDGVVP